MKRQHSGRIRLAALLALGSLAAAGCGSGSSTNSDSSANDGKYPAGTTITVWADDTRTPVVTDIGKSFQADKGVTVKVVQKDFSKLKDQFTTQAPSGKGPDIIVGAHDWIGGLVDSGTIAPLELGTVADSLQDVAVKAVTYDGQTYGLPYAVENIALLRNKKLAPTAPKDFNDMLKIGNAAVAAGKAKYPVLIQQDATNGDPYHLYPFQQSFGAGVFAQNDDGSFNPDQLTIGDANGVKFAQWLSQMGKQKVLNPNISYDVAQQQFTAGKSPFIVTGPWMLDPIQKAGIDLAIDPLPSAGGQPANPFVGVQAFMVSAKSKNPIVANDFVLNYLGTEDAQKKLFDAGKRPSANKAVFEASASDPIYAGFGKVGAEGVPQPNIPAMDAVWAEWGKTEMAIIKGGDPAKLWAGMTKKIQATIKGN